nr:ABC transporter permease [Chlorobium phaeovibrioides]
MNFAILFTLFSVFLLLSGSFPGWSFLALFLVLAIQILFSVGLGLILGVLNVFFRDVGQFFGIALTFWFWLTPIVYPAAILPEAVKRLMHLNPMYSLIQAYQGILVQGEWPDLQTLLYPFILALVFCAYGFTLFRKHSGDMIDEL